MKNDAYVIIGQINLKLELQGSLQVVQYSQEICLCFSNNIFSLDQIFEIVGEKYCGKCHNMKMCFLNILLFILLKSVYDFYPHFRYFNFIHIFAIDISQYILIKFSNAHSNSLQYCIAIKSMRSQSAMGICFQVFCHSTSLVDSQLFIAKIFMKKEELNNFFLYNTFTNELLN